MKSQNTRVILISGVHAVTDELEHSYHNIVEVYVRHSINNQRVIDIVNRAKNYSHIKVIYKSKNYLTNLVNNASHQGIIAKIIVNNTANETELLKFLQSGNKTTILMLDSVTDTRNLGACIRSAAVFGVDCIIIGTKNVATINNNTYKASAGTVNRVKIFRVTNLARVINTLKKYGFWIIGLDANSTQTLNDYDFKEPCVLVMGSEDKGIKKLVKKKCDVVLKIPLVKNADSLNVAVATGVVLYKITHDNS